MSVKQYLEEAGIDTDILPIEVVILVCEDEECDMAYVAVDGNIIYEGNTWDYHDGCYGGVDIGEFNSIGDFVELLELGLQEMGHVVSHAEGTYVYEY